MADASMAFEKRAVVVAREAFAIFMLVTESDDSGPIAEELVVGLRVGGAPRFVIGKRLRIGSGKIEYALTGYAKAVRPADGDQIPQVVGLSSSERIERLSGWRRSGEEGTELSKGELYRVVPAFSGLLLGGDTNVSVLVPLRGTIRNSVEVNGVRRAQGCRCVANGGADSGGSSNVPAKICANRGVVEKVIRKAALGVKPRKLREVVEPMECAT